MAINNVKKDKIRLIYKVLESQNFQSWTCSSNSGVLGEASKCLVN